MIAILTSCTNSKTKKANKTLTIQHYQVEEFFDDVVELWKKEVNENDYAKYLVTELYKGVGWKATIDTNNKLSSKYKTALYIASAGYGLIASNSKIASYDATFAPRTSNSINKFTNDKRANIEWWDNINDFKIEDFPHDSYFFIILPHNYLIATQNFIKKIIEKYDKKVFIFIANQNETLSFMRGYTIEFDLRFNSYQTGTLSSLLARAVLWLTDEIIKHEIPFEHHLFQSHIEEKMKNYTHYKMPKREQLSEEDLIKEIEKMINKDEIESASRGLKKLRESGIACEQKRFGSLFKKVKSQL